MSYNVPTFLSFSIFCLTTTLLRGIMILSNEERRKPMSKKSRKRKERLANLIIKAVGATAALIMAIAELVKAFR